MSRDERSTGLDEIPMVARWGTEHPSAPLVVALHGNGTSEHSMIEMAPWLPHGPVAYVSVRAPIEQGTGFGWFPDTGDGRTDPAGLAQTARWFLDWLDTEGDPDRPILLLAFREGVAFAGALMLGEPHRFAGAVLLYGALPLVAQPSESQPSESQPSESQPSESQPSESQPPESRSSDFPTPMTRGRLAGMPVFLAHGTDDPRTPAPLLAQTWDWLTRESGAPVWAERGPGGAQLAGKVVGDVGTWLGDRLDHLRAHGENPLPDGDEPDWPTVPGGRLPARSGEPPEVTAAIPQHQVSQNAPPHLQVELWDRLAALDAVATAPATVGVAGTRALLLDRDTATGPDAAFILPALGEFTHLHPESDGSLHVVLPDELAYDALAKGWAVAHPLAGVRVSPGMVLVPGPRDAGEVEVVAGIAGASHRYAATG